jgi:hypothetical protein
MLLDWNSSLIHQIGHVALSKINVHPQGMKILGQQICSEESDGSPAGHSIRVNKYSQQWQHCWAKCVAAQRDYCEGDTSH